MASTRKRSSSARSNNSENSIRLTPTPSPLNGSINIPEDLILNDVPSYHTSTTSLLIPSQGSGSPYPAISGGGSPYPQSHVSTPQRARASTADQSGGQQRGYSSTTRSGQQFQAYQPGQRQASAPQAIDLRSQYIPQPPSSTLSPPQHQQQQQHHMMSLPPPPPRPTPITSPHTMMLPPPPGPPPAASYNVSSGWGQQTWGRQGYIPPPPPMLPVQAPTAAHAPYNPSHGYQNHQPPPIAIPPPPPQFDGPPLTSATYIPDGLSFGPGVGIPPLGSMQQPSFNRGDSSNFHADADAAKIAADHRFFNGPQSPSSPNQDMSMNERFSNQSVPQTPLTRHHPLLIPTRDTQEQLATGQAVLNAQSQSSLIPTSATGQEPANHGHRHTSSHNSASSPKPTDPPSQWPIDQVLIWLAANGFSNDWQESFRILDIQGSDFLELGRGHGGRGNFGMMHQLVYPRLAQECSKSGTGWDQAREREEGKRMRRLIRRIADNDDSRKPGHARRESSQVLPSASSEGAMESSPNLGRLESFTNTPTTAGAGGDSPVRQMSFRSTSQGLGNRVFSNGRTGTAPTYANTGMTASDVNAADPEQPSQSRTGFSRSILSGINDAVVKRHHSPSTSVESSAGAPVMGTSLYGGSVRSGQAASPQSGSPALQQAVLSSSGGTPNLIAPPNCRFGHHKTNSTDSVSSAARGRAASASIDQSGIGRLQDSRRNGQDSARPPDLKIIGRQGSNDAPPSAKEHSKGFLNKFRKRKKDEAAHTSPEDHALDSPTSPQNYRIIPPNLPFARASRNNSDTSLERPSSTSTMAEQDKLAFRGRALARPSPGRKYIFATPDHWNYRLIDITDVDSASALRETICRFLGIEDSDYAQIYLTEPGQLEHDEPLSDAILLLSKRTRADANGNLKFFVQRGAISAGYMPAPMPAPMSAGLGIGFSTKALPSPIVANSHLRKSVEEANSSRSTPNSQTQPGSPPASTRQTNLRAGISSHWESPVPDQVVSDEPPLESPSTEAVRVRLEVLKTAQQRGTLPDSERVAWLEAAIQEHKRDVEAKQRAYLEAKQAKLGKQSPTDSGTWSIKRDGVIDFDTRRLSPYEDKKTELLIPLRKPPPAPAESTTLMKANSLSKRTSDRYRISLSGQMEDMMKRSSLGEAITEDSTEHGQRQAAAAGASAGAAQETLLADVGKRTGSISAPGRTVQLSRNQSLRMENGRDRGENLVSRLQAVDLAGSGSNSTSPGRSPMNPRFTHGRHGLPSTTLTVCKVRATTTKLRSPVRCHRRRSILWSNT